MIAEFLLSEALRGIMQPETPNPDVGADYLIATGQLDRREVEEITLDEWREKIDRTWKVYRL